MKIRNKKATSCKAFPDSSLGIAIEKTPPSGSQDSQFVAETSLELPSTLPALMIITKTRKWLSPLNKVFLELNDRPH